jgi:hypothetical protein
MATFSPAIPRVKAEPADDAPVFVSHTLSMGENTYSPPAAVDLACREMEHASEGLLELRPMNNKDGKLFIQIGFESAPDVDLLAETRSAACAAVLGGIRGMVDRIERNMAAMESERQKG